MKKLYILLLIIVFGTPIYAQNPSNGVLYVNKNVASGGNKDGSSWANAIPELADALKWANANKASFSSNNPLQIWVAKGKYLPKYTPEDGKNFSATPADMRDRSFLMVENVKLYGGFVGTESNISQRVLPVQGIGQQTILSGDFNNDDVIGAMPAQGAPSISNNGENAYHVVLAVSNNTAINIAIDGFTIQGGNANVNDRIKVNGLFVSQNNGGGISSSSSYYYSSVVLTNSSVSGNTANGSGGGISSSSYSSSSSVVLTNSSVSGNMANYGSGISSYSSFSSSSVVLTNSSVSGNTANYGGGIYSYAFSSSSVNLYNATLAGNKADALVYFDGGTSKFKAYNSLIFGNIKTDNSASNVFNVTPNVKDIQNSLVQGESGTANGNLDGTSTTYTTANLFNNYATGDYSLKAGSAAINKGKNIWVTVTKDLAGNDRIRDALVDLGAYEYQQGNTIPVGPDANGIIYVKSGAANTGTGVDWDHAYPELADALHWAALYKTIYPDQSLKIFVAKGIYKPLYNPTGSSDVRDMTFSLVKDVSIYGGFDPDNNIKSLNDVRIKPSINNNGSVLSGDIGVLNNSTDNAYHVVLATGDLGTVLLDGFGITGGNANGTGGSIGQQYNGAGLYNNNTGSLSLDHLVFYNNIAQNPNAGGSTDGGGLYTWDSALKIRNTLFAGNKALGSNGRGGAVFIGGAKSPSFSNVSISNNQGSNGGGFYNDGNTGNQINNSIIWGNTSNGSTSNNVAKANGATNNFKNSLVQGESSTANGNLDGTSTSYTTANLFNNYAAGDYSLKYNSPVIDKGSNQLYLANGGQNTDLDLLGNPRFAGIIDMGAYEQQCKTLIPAPTGNAVQSFNAGDDLSVLVVNGQNVKWYGNQTDAENHVNSIPISTLIVNKATYYATQTIGVCESASALAVKAYNPVLGTIDNSITKILLYPNPVKDVLNLSSKNKINKVVITTLEGRKIMDKTFNGEKNLNVQNLIQGVYLITVFTENTTQVIKFIKD